MEDNLNLICGDPRINPASFTRFVYPFAYNVSPLKPVLPKEEDKDKTLHYIECKEKSLNACRQYFTHETNEVLFETAKWLEMEEHSWAKTSWANSILFYCREKEIAVSMLPPRLVLFEWCDHTILKGKKIGETEILQTGFLLLDLFFPDTNGRKCAPELDDLLLINDYFRFFRCPYYQHSKQFKALLREVPIEYGLENPQKVGNERIRNEKTYLDRWINLLTFSVKIDEKEYYLKTCHDSSDEKFLYADNRAYVWSAALLYDGAGALKKAFTKKHCQAHEFGHWIRLLNVDGPDLSDCPEKTHKNVTKFEKKWAEDRTYHRWEEKGTWYGFSYHAGVMLGPPLNEPGPPLWRHFRQNYFSMTLLLFYVRISLFRFSRCLTKITPLTGIYNENSNDAFNRLRAIFSIFTIRYQFPLLSNQQQAIEMYHLARKYFDIDNLYSEVKEEINNTHEFLESELQGKLSHSAYLLAKLGIPLALAALLVSVLSLICSIFDITYSNGPFFSRVNFLLHGIFDGTWLKSFIRQTWLDKLSISTVFIIVSVFISICFLVYVKFKLKSRAGKSGKNDDC